MDSIKTGDTGWQKGSGWGSTTKRSSVKATKKSSPASTIVVGIIFALIGAGIGLYFYMSSTKEANIVSTGIQTTGTITGAEYREDRKTTTSNSSSSSQRRESHYIMATVEYSTTDGSYHTFKKKVPISREDYNFRTASINVGDTITVYYDPDKPESAAVEEWITHPGMAILLGGVFTIVGIVMTISGARKALKKKRETTE